MTTDVNCGIPRERLEANYHQKVTIWTTDKTSLVRCNLVGHVLALL